LCSFIIHHAHVSKQEMVHQSLELLPRLAAGNYLGGAAPVVPAF